MQLHKRRVRCRLRLRRTGSTALGGGGCGCEERCGGARVDEVPQGVELFEGGVPFTREDVSSEFSPVRGGRQVVVGGEDAEVVKVVGGAGVRADGVLEFSKGVESGDLLRCKLWIGFAD